MSNTLQSSSKELVMGESIPLYKKSATSQADEKSTQDEIIRNQRVEPKYYENYLLPHPRVQRIFNRPLFLIMLLSLLSFLAILLVVFANMFLQFIYAIYLSWERMAKVLWFFYTCAAVWLMVDFFGVFIIIFANLWSYASLSWACKYDERGEILALSFKDGECQREENNKEFLCFEVGMGTLLRGAYVSFLLILSIIVFFSSDWEVEVSSFVESLAVASTLSGLIYFTGMFIWDYIILLNKVHQQRKNVVTKAHKVNKPSCWLLFQEWIFWIISKNPYLKESPKYLRAIIVLTELFVSPIFITSMFSTQSYTSGTLFFCVLIPILHYTLTVLQSSRKDIKSTSKADEVSEGSDSDGYDCFEFNECCNDKCFDNCFDKYIAPVLKLVTWNNLKGLITRKKWEICIAVVFLLVATFFIAMIGLIMLDEHEPLPLTESSSYPACKLRFEFGDDILGPIEMALFAKLAYLDPSMRYKVMDYVFGAESYEIILRNSISPDERGTQFFHVASKHSKSLVRDNFVVIRGTTTISDCLQDMKMWTEISSIQMVNLMIPLLTFWPISFTNKLIKALSATQNWMGGAEMVDYLESVSAHVSDFLPSVNEYIKNPENSTEHVMTIGHSLGGGIASLVASREYEPYRNETVPPRVNSFGLSPVGTIYSSSKFGGSWYAVEETATSIFSRRDPVPLVDGQGGLTERIPCTQPFFPQCHSSLVTICELHRQCRLPLDGKNRAEKENLLNCMCCTENLEDITPSEYCAKIIHNNSYTRSCNISQIA